MISPSAHVYESLSGDGGSPAVLSPTHAGAFVGDDSDNDDGDYFYSRRQAPKTFLQRIGLAQRTELPESNYLTLIPLSDERLRPRHTTLLVSCLLLLAFALAGGVFVVVPRGVTVGSIQVRSSHMSFNTSKSTYQIILTATIPIFNPNYLPVQVSGDLVVSFYDQQAGLTSLEPMQIPARAFPQVLTVDMDASSVPQQYLFTIYTQCFTFPERIIFFLTGKLKSRFLGWVLAIPDIDNYFIISCSSTTAEPPPPTRPTRPPHAPPQPPRPPRPPRPGFLGIAGEAAALEGADGAAAGAAVAGEMGAAQVEEAEAEKGEQGEEEGEEQAMFLAEEEEMLKLPHQRPGTQRAAAAIRERWDEAAMLSREDEAAELARQGEVERRWAGYEEALASWGQAVAVAAEGRDEAEGAGRGQLGAVEEREGVAVDRTEAGAGAGEAGQSGWEGQGKAAQDEVGQAGVRAGVGRKGSIGSGAA
ncbi:hypothetical protein HYH03_011348 [Edaphochlamys debaryana]|uniref:Uncharacterized protein n=1 Tax=Edaphochlamys debaryana TaxID=47281 RepID=A0A835XWA9_9CHLO|nr:hypothetical protein HYH03_011348 [Edaphochlamys debaryana]|eukprot:KAG2490223.1 hypothetical protein HYH03_011348 [Edaphochlamys debaryana]